MLRQLTTVAFVWSPQLITHMLVCRLMFQAGRNWLIEAMPWQLSTERTCATAHHIFFVGEPVNNYSHVSVVASELCWQMELFAIFYRRSGSLSTGEKKRKASFCLRLCWRCWSSRQWTGFRMKDRVNISEFSQNHLQCSSGHSISTIPVRYSIEGRVEGIQRKRERESWWGEVGEGGREGGRAGAIVTNRPKIHCKGRRKQNDNCTKKKCLLLPEGGFETACKHDGFNGGSSQRNCLVTEGRWDAASNWDTFSRYFSSLDKTNKRQNWQGKCAVEWVAERAREKEKWRKTEQSVERRERKSGVVMKLSLQCMCFHRNRCLA